MSLLSTISKPQQNAIMCTICGSGGMGKTSFAATFPKPIFIRTEPGVMPVTDDMVPDAFPIVTKATQFWEYIIALVKEDHDYKTLVIDTVTSLERLFCTEVLESDPKAKGMNQALGGYGNGWSAVASQHERVRRAATVLLEEKGMNIVFLAHADIETMKLPDQDDFQRYTLRMNGKSLPPYVDDVDLVGFIRLATFVKGGDGERKKAISTGERELVTYATASNVSKNRFGIVDPIELEQGENPLFEIVPSLKLSRKPVSTPKPQAQPTEGVEK